MTMLNTPLSDIDMYLQNLVSQKINNLFIIVCFLSDVYLNFKQFRKISILFAQQKKTCDT
jgi:hypothetical protein